MADYSEIAAASRALNISGLQFKTQNAVKVRGATSYGLLLAFVFLLYLNVPIVLPALELIHPAKLVGAAALLALISETWSGQLVFGWGWPEGAFLIAFLAVSALSCLTALWPSYAAAIVADLTKMVLVYFFLANCAVTWRRIRGVMWIMILGGLIPSAGVLRNYIAGRMVENRTAWVGIFANPNDLAASLVILIPLAGFLALRSGFLGRLTLSICVVIYSLAVFVTFSRGGLVGLIIVVCLFAWRQPSWAIKLTLLVAMTAGILFAGRYWSRAENFSNLKTDNSFQERLATSKAGLEMFADHPLLGVGPACSVIAWPLYAPKGFYTRGALVTHNTVIQALSETGALGFTAFLSFLGMGTYRARRLATGSTGVDSAQVGAALEIALWGFIVCGLSAGDVFTWFVYILVGLVSAASRMGERTDG